VTWLQNGAQPTDTAKAILSYKGALLKNHLAGGVRKGALTEAQAEAKFTAWLEEKGGKVTVKEEGLTKSQADAKAKALAAEKAVNEARIEAAKPVVEEVVAEEVVAEVEAAPETIDEAAAKAAE
jgi:small subunit ribosomal protein S16